MKIFSHLDDVFGIKPNCCLTIGVFDGVHLGHQAILKRVIETKEDSDAVMLSFKNSPISLIHPNNQKPLIYSLDQKVKLFEELGIDKLILIEFTFELANQNYKDFLISLKKKVPFTSLILGETASFGKNREGNKQNIIKLTEELNFKAEFVPIAVFQNQPISSSLIRTLIANKDFKTVEKMLNRPLNEEYLCQATCPVEL
ncbi:MAG: FAD synthetase family protein [Chlamydiae bacterium]|nr:FAD synthetase family protein [Chlamydiota bacterium]